MRIMKQINSAGEFNVSIQSSNLIVAVFKADWCGDCKYMNPFMPEVEEKYSDRLTLIEVDVDKVGDVSQEQNIMGIPSFVAYTDGRELVRFVNKLRKSREEIEDFLNKALNVYHTLHDTAERKE
ncbi:Thioredoxin-like protein YtpP [compost metagenome]